MNQKQLSGYQVIRLSGYQVIRLSGYQVIRLSGYQVIRFDFSSIKTHISLAKPENLKTCKLENVSSFLNTHNLHLLLLRYQDLEDAVFGKSRPDLLRVDGARQCYRP